MVVGFNKSVDFLKTINQNRKLAINFLCNLLNTFTYYQTSTHEWEKNKHPFPCFISLYGFAQGIRLHGNVNDTAAGQPCPMFY